MGHKLCNSNQTLSIKKLQQARCYKVIFLTYSFKFCNLFFPEYLECPESCCQEKDNIPEKWSLHRIKWLDNGYSARYHCRDKHSSTYININWDVMIVKNMTIPYYYALVICNPSTPHRPGGERGITVEMSSVFTFAMSMH